MPFTNEHASRLQDPSKFDTKTFRRTKGGTIYGKVTVPATISIIWAKLKEHNKPEDNPIPQSLRFPIKSWTAEKAKKWLKDHNVSYMSFEPASQKKDEPAKTKKDLVHDRAKFEIPIEIIKAKEEKKDDKTEWQVDFWASTSDIDSGADKITKEALKGAEKDLLKYSSVLLNHDTAQIVGKVIDTKVKKHGEVWGLWVRAVISKTAEDTWTKIKEGILKHFSIRGQVLDAVKTWDKALKRYIREIKEILLLEVSLVAIPANPEADLIGWKEIKKGMGFFITKSLDIWEQEGGVLKEEELIEKEVTTENKSKVRKGVNKLMKLDELIIKLDEEIALLKSLIDSETDEARKSLLEKSSQLRQSEKDALVAKKELVAEVESLTKLAESETDEVKKQSLMDLVANTKERQEMSKTKVEDKFVKKEDESVGDFLKRIDGDIQASFPKDAEETQKEGFVESVKKEIQAGKSFEEAIKGCSATLKKKEVAKKDDTSYTKKSEGDYTQKEVDVIVAELEKRFKGELDAKDTTISDLEKSLEETKGTLEKERTERTSEKATEMAEKKWKELVSGKKYNLEDEKVILPILKKSFEGINPTGEETMTLVERSNSESKLLADTFVKDGLMTEEKKAGICKELGIKTKVKE